MKNLLLTVLAFGLLSSSAFAEEGLTLIVLPSAMSMSVSPNNQNTARSRLQLQAISPVTQKNMSALSAMSTGLRECRSSISRQRNTSAMMHLSYLSSSPMALAGKFITT
jgi:hypothetical protein